jgi:predicted solute-binding protein
MIFGPFGKAWLAIVSHLFFFADILSVVQGFPVEFNHSVASVGVEKRNPTTAT